MIMGGYWYALFAGDAFVVQASMGALTAATTLERAPGAYNASVALNVAGEYDVRVQLHGALLGTAVGAAAQYALLVAPGPASAAASRVEGAALAGTQAGKEATVAVLLRDAGGAPAADSLRSASLEVCRAQLLRTDKMEEEVENLAEEAVTAICEDGGEGALRVRYTATAAGLYALSVYLDGVAVGSSPYQRLAVTPAEPSLLTTSAPKGGCCVAGAKVELVFTARDFFGNARGVGGDEVRVAMVMAGGDGGARVEGRVRDNDDGLYSVALLVPLAGEYTMEVHLNGHRVPTDTTYKFAHAPTDPARSFVRDPRKVNSIVAGEPTDVHIVPRSTVGLPQPPNATALDAWEVTVFPEASSRVVGSETLAEVLTAPQWQPDGSFRFRYRARKVLTSPAGALGTYRLDVALRGTPLEGSPFYVTVVPATADASRSRLYLPDSSPVEAGTTVVRAVAGAGVRVELGARDAYDNDAVTVEFAAGAVVEATLVGESAEAGAAAEAQVVPCDVADYRTGRYGVTCNATVAGTYALAVTLDGRAVGGEQGGEEAAATVTVVVDPGPNDPSQFVVGGTPLHTPVVAFEVAFLTVQCRDAFGNTRVDDGSLLPSASASVFEEAAWRLEATAVVTRGDVLAANAETLPVESVEVMYRAQPPAEGLTNGTYVVRVRSAYAGTLAVSLAMVSGAGRRVALQGPAGDKLPSGAMEGAGTAVSTVVATVVAATATTAQLFGPVSAGTCLVGAPMPLYLMPQDAGGNAATLAANASLDVQVFPTHLATVTAPMLRDDGVWECALTAAAAAAGIGVTVEARLGGEHVAGSPAVLLVREGYAPVNPLRSFAAGGGLAAALVGGEASFLVQLVTDRDELYPLSKERMAGTYCTFQVWGIGVHRGGRMVSEGEDLRRDERAPLTSPCSPVSRGGPFAGRCFPTTAGGVRAGVRGRQSAGGGGGQRRGSGQLQRHLHRHVPRAGRRRALR